MCSEQPRQAVIVNSIFHFVLRKDGSENESKYQKLRVFMRSCPFSAQVRRFGVSEFQLFVNAILLPCMCICNLQQETSHLMILQSSSQSCFLFSYASQKIFFPWHTCILEMYPRSFHCQETYGSVWSPEGLLLLVACVNDCRSPLLSMLQPVLITPMCVKAMLEEVKQELESRSCY